MKKRNIGYIITFLVIFIACLWAFISAGIITKNFKAKMLKDDFAQKEVNIDNLLVTETKDGQKLWELYADTGHYDNKNNVAYLNNIIGNFYKENKVVASFKSSQGTYNATNKHIVLYSDTLIVYKDGSNVKANQIVWEGKDSDIKATGKIRLEKPSQAVLYGNEAVLSNDLSNFKILGKTRTEIYSKGKLEL
ncbi:MAG: LPS export ABC transporter periplasmic protein LptC [Candidatus Gastranaerophilales bacterium]|nr:LPS export ABC transporter periplasmic protein LptC [Candidatus Gastranaerophilales bacterium]